ncbi:CAP domain-containing protein [Psychrobacillus sp. NPDC058041]|uniref:CAP domain-containing protein n=1 Tax=Psychrobacillus sp. NPDC058041 TaxID=3346310 RepID=UPI0036D81DD7
MNKKHSIIVGLLAGGLLLSTNTANAAMTSGNSNTTSEAKATVVMYQWNSPFEFMTQYNWKNLENFNFNSFVPSNQTIDKLIENQLQGALTPAAPVKKPVADKPVTPVKKPVAETPVTPVKKPVTETPVTPVQKPVADKPVTPVQQPVTQQTPPNNSQEVKVPAAVQEVVDLTNKERAKEGLKALQIDVKLTQSAQAKSQDMKNKNYFDHTSPTFGSPFDQMKSLGITYKSAGENIAMGQRSAAEVVDAWMKSPGHRENIMNPSFTHIGVGLSDSGFYWTQQFIGK